MGKLNLHDGEISCNGRGRKREEIRIAQRHRGRRVIAEKREARAQAKAYATTRQRFSGGFGWDKMAGEGLEK
jgi:hypothetical protein